MQKYAYRIETRMVKEVDFPYSGEILSSPVALHQFTKTLHDMDVEKCLFLYLNSRNKLVCIKSYEGSNNSCTVSKRDAVKIALLLNCPAVLVVHNHPSGGISPSPEDYHLTEELKKAFGWFDIKLMDHCIVSENEYFSFNEQGKL